MGYASIILGWSPFLEFHSFSCFLFQPVSNLCILHSRDLWYICRLVTKPNIHWHHVYKDTLRPWGSQWGQIGTYYLLHQGILLKSNELNNCISSDWRFLKVMQLAKNVAFKIGTKCNAVPWSIFVGSTDHYVKIYITHPKHKTSNMVITKVKVNP